MSMTIIIGARLSDDLAVIVADQLISCEDGPLSKHSKNYIPKVEINRDYVVGICGDAECGDIFLEGCRSLHALDDIAQLYRRVNEDYVAGVSSRLSKLQPDFADDDFSCDAIVAFNPEMVYALEFAAKPRLVRDYAVMGIGEFHANRYLKQVQWRSSTQEQRLLHVFGAYHEAVMKNLYCDGVPTVYVIDMFNNLWREDTGTIALRLATCDSSVISQGLKEEVMASLLLNEPEDVLDFAEKIALKSSDRIAARRHLYGFSSGKVI